MCIFNLETDQRKEQRAYEASELKRKSSKEILGNANGMGGEKGVTNEIKRWKASNRKKVLVIFFNN